MSTLLLSLSILSFIQQLSEMFIYVAPRTIPFCGSTFVRSVVPGPGPLGVGPRLDSL